MQPLKLVRSAGRKRTSVASLGLLDSLSLAATRPIALVIGALFGAAVSGGVYWVWHHEIHTTATYTWSTFCDPRCVLVLAGLVYSLHTVTEIATKVLGRRWKAFAFAVLMESLMVLSTTEAVSLVALCYVASINALGAGLVLVRGSRAIESVTLRP